MTSKKNFSRKHVEMLVFFLLAFTSDIEAEENKSFGVKSKNLPVFLGNDAAKLEEDTETRPERAEAHVTSSEINLKSVKPRTNFRGNSPLLEHFLNLFNQSIIASPVSTRIVERLLRIRLFGSQLSYMGQVQVGLVENQWGTVCGDGWGDREAAVVCRQLGFAGGSVSARPNTEFGNSTLPVVMTRVKCKGMEKNLGECSATEWKGNSPLPCTRSRNAAGVVCGCPISVKGGVRSHCYIFTESKFQRMYCLHSCPPGQTLVGPRRRYCENSRKWSGIPPKCVNATDIDPCHPSPCKNGGICEADLTKQIDYKCVCPHSYGGKNCQFQRTWSCGRPEIEPDLRHVRPGLRIVGGKMARNGSWPWIVQLRLRDRHFCGGTLISPLWVLTAQHCFTVRGIPNGPNSDPDLNVISGQHRLTGHDITSQIHNVSYIIGQAFTSFDIPRQDIALLLLTHPIIEDEFTSPICLPSSPHHDPAPGTKCWTAGWGRANHLGWTPPALQQADLPIVSTSRCKSLSWKNAAKSFRLVADDMLCAGYLAGQIDSCSGDSGGPLMCHQESGSWYTAGIVSWGYSCGDPYSPGVYTRISYYLDWIYDVISTKTK